MSYKFTATLACLFFVLNGYSFAQQEEITYYHYDALGSPVLATDEAGNVRWREEYSPFGSRLVEESRELDCTVTPCEPTNSPWENRLFYTGKYDEADAGLTYFGARWYDPSLGRFLSVDPVEFYEGNIFSFNRYAYANNNPYSYIDPDGREVMQVGFSLRTPKFLGIVDRLLGTQIKFSGVSFGVVVSVPDAVTGRGEYDAGFFMTTALNAEGLDTGRASFDYSQSVDPGASVKDVAGIGGGASASFGMGGVDVSYSENGFESVGIHIGPGAGAEGHAEATSTLSIRHGRRGWNATGDNRSENE